MSTAVQRYRRYALVIWGAVGLVVGFLLISLFDLSGREQLFPLALVVGLYVLFMMKLFGWRERRGDVDGPAGELVDPEGRKDGSAAVVVDEASVESLVATQGNLSTQERRTWLDGFLVRQQHKG